MDFLRSIEEDLYLVEAETKKKLPAVKDAAEKGIEKIGQIRQLYAQMLRVETAPGPGNAIFKSDAILRPFLLACNHATASQKLLIASFNSIQKLVSWDAITSEAVGNILRVLHIQAERNSHQDIQLKLLQTLLQLLTLAFNKGDEQMTNEDLISQAIWVCLHLQSQSGNPITSNTAVMTLRQVVTMVFDNVTAHQASNNANLDGAKKVGFLVFQDLCLMSREEAGVWLKRTTFSKILGVELLEAVLTSHATLFRTDVEFRSMLKQHAKHLITANLSPSTSFPLLLRIMRLASTVLSQFSALLEDECNTIWLCLIEIVSTGTFAPNGSATSKISLSPSPPPFLHMQRRSHHDSSSQLRSMHAVSSSPNPSVSSHNLSSSSSSSSASVNYVTWQVLLAMEVIFKACGEPDVLPALSSYPNHLLLVLARTVSAVVTTSPPCDYRPGHADVPVPYRCGLEYLNEQEAPQMQPFYNVLRIALLCQYHLLTALHANERQLSPLRVQYILCSVAPFVMNALHCTMRFCREAELVTVALKGYHLLTNVNAHTRGLMPLEGRPIGVLAIQALCVYSFPVPDTATRLVKCISGTGALLTMEISDGGDVASDGSVDQCVLTWKEMHAMKTLFRTIHTMEQELNEIEWRTLLEGFEVIVGLSALKQKTKGVSQRIGTGPSAVKVEDEDVEQQLVMLGQSVLEYFHNTSALQPTSMLHILRAIRSICYEQINQTTPALVATPPSADDAAKMPVVEEELQQLLALWSPDQQMAWDVLSLPFTHHLKTYDTTLGIGGAGGAAAFSPSFSLRMFVQLAKTNVDAWTFVMEELVGFACLSTLSPSLLPFQTFATDSVYQLVQHALTTTRESQARVAAYVLRVIASEHMKERALVGLLDLLQTTGHLITQDAWPLILQALVTSAEYDARCQVVAFKSLRLVVDDLVTSMESPSRQACISCVGAYATHAKDVNISLTAINELWTLADTIAKKATDDEVALWPTAFSELKRIALDSRPEVRNCAINTLFGTAVTHGAQFRLVEWTIFLQGTILPLAHQLSAAVATAPEPSVASVADAGAGDLPPPPVVVLHHSRDSVAKQYDESRVLVLSGVSRVLQTNTSSLLLHADWFVLVWRDLIEYISSCCGDKSMSKEVVLAGIQTLHTLLQIASTSSQDLSAAPLRAGVGMRVVNGVCTTPTAASATNNSAAHPTKKPSTLLSRDPQLWTQAFDLLLRLADDRALGTTAVENTAQEQDIASAMVTVFVSIYLQSRESELHDVTKLHRILHVFDKAMHRFVLAKQTNNTPLVVTTSSLHARILNSYDECGYFDEAVHVDMVHQVVGFVRQASTSPCLVFVLRHALQSLAKVYENVSPVAQAATFVDVVAAIAPFFDTKNNLVPDSATASEKASLTMWKHALKVLLALIGFGMQTVPQSSVAALFQVVETVLAPHKASPVASDADDVVALELSVLERLVLAMMVIQYDDPRLTNRFMALLHSDAAASDDTRVTSARIQHMTMLGGPTNPNLQLRDACRHQLNAVFVDAIAAFLSEKGTAAAEGSQRNRVVVLLTSLSRSPQSVLEVFPSLCRCITCDDAEVRKLVQTILLESDVAGVCLPLLHRAAGRRS